MKQGGPVDQNTERDRTRYIRQNAAEPDSVSISRGERFRSFVARIVLIALVVCIFISLISCPALQAGLTTAQTVPTVTPYPGPVATATAAAQSINQAQTDKARADELARQANDQARQAQADLNAARSNQIAAQNAIQAQQVAQAMDLIGSAQARIDSGLAKIDELVRDVNEHQTLVSGQASQIISLTIENQQLRTDKQTIKSNYDAVAAQLQTEQQNRPATVNPIPIIAGIGISTILIGLLLFWLSRRGNTIKTTPSVMVEPPPIEGDYTDEEDRSL